MPLHDQFVLVFAYSLIRSTKLKWNYKSSESIRYDRIAIHATFDMFIRLCVLICICMCVFIYTNTCSLDSCALFVHSVLHCVWLCVFVRFVSFFFSRVFFDIRLYRMTVKVFFSCSFVAVFFFSLSLYRFFQSLLLIFCIRQNELCVVYFVRSLFSNVVLLPMMLNAALTKNEFTRARSHCIGDGVCRWRWSLSDINTIECNGYLFPFVRFHLKIDSVVCAFAHSRIRFNYIWRLNFILLLSILKIVVIVLALNFQYFHSRERNISAKFENGKQTMKNCLFFSSSCIKLMNTFDFGCP